MFSGGGIDFSQVGRFQGFQDTVIQMKAVETQINREVKELESRQLPGPGQPKIGPGLTDTVKV